MKWLFSRNFWRGFWIRFVDSYRRQEQAPRILPLWVDWCSHLLAAVAMISVALVVATGWAFLWSPVAGAVATFAFGAGYGLFLQLSSDPEDEAQVDRFRQVVDDERAGRMWSVFRAECERIRDIPACGTCGARRFGSALTGNQVTYTLCGTCTCPIVHDPAACAECGRVAHVDVKFELCGECGGAAPGAGIPAPLNCTV